MFPFGHAGFALGLAVVASAVQSRLPMNHVSEAETVGNAGSGDSAKQSVTSTLGRYGDLRILLLGTWLPDIIDKPVGVTVVGAGKLFFHTLVFPLLIFAVGAYLWHRRKKSWLLLLSAGVFTHLIFDQMWLVRRTFLWPLYGWAFPHGVRSEWLGNILYALLHNPGAYVPEIIGLAILLCFGVYLIRRKSLVSFIKYGVIS